MNADEGPLYDVGIVGSGMAGMSAALFAAGRGLSTVLIGRTGEIIFATGLLDLLGVHPVEAGRTWKDPFAGIAALIADHPRHPYARVPADAIRTAFAEVLALLEEAGLPYTGRGDLNVAVPTMAGTCKLTYRVPRTMWAGAAALERREPVLLLDIRGLKGFSARQAAGAFAPGGAEVRTAAIALPERPSGGDVFTERLARGLEHPAGRERFAAAIAAQLRGESAVGVPAVLGVSASAAVMDDIRARIGRPLFEIPTMPPGVTGLRLKEAFERGLAGRGVRLHLDSRVFGVATGPGGGFRLAAGRVEPEATIRAAALILATGRFMGGGLKADRGRVRETLFDLPVRQPPARDGWHREEFLDPRGHPVNAAGIETDEAFRPLAEAGRVRHPLLFAAGSILAHQDWMRMKCGAGIAFATAWEAVRQAAAALGRVS